MFNEIVYDLAIIGGGISSCVFVSTHIKNGFNGSIAVIENGRNLGGRSSTRNSFANSGWQFNHGAPNINIQNITNDELLKTFIKELLDSKFIQADSSDFIELYDDSVDHKSIKSDFCIGKNYISTSSMSDLSENIISMSDFRNSIDYFFETLIVKLDYECNTWILTSKNGQKLKTKFLVCSSNLILHKRSLDIFKVNQIPLRKAIPKNQDLKIDKIIKLLYKQDYIQRLSFLIYTKSDYCFKDKYNKKYRYFLFNDLLEEKYKFERIIFQKQIDDKLGFVLHTKNKDFINQYFKSNNKETFKKNLITKFNLLFDTHPHINKLIDYQDISIMRWRASQPFGMRIPENLQVCENYNIAFCGDWFDLEGFGRIEGAILSALRLSYKLSQ